MPFFLGLVPIERQITSRTQSMRHPVEEQTRIWSFIKLTSIENFETIQQVQFGKRTVFIETVSPDVDLGRRTRSCPVQCVGQSKIRCVGENESIFSNFQPLTPR